MATSEPVSTDKEQIRARIAELAKLSKELEANARMQASAANIVAAEQLKKRVVELSDIQAKKMRELVSLHPDPGAQEHYEVLGKRIEDAQAELKATKDMQEIRRLEGVIVEHIGVWVHHFQTMVSQLAGAPPPDKPVYV